MPSPTIAERAFRAFSQSEPIAIEYIRSATICGYSDGLFREGTIYVHSATYKMIFPDTARRALRFIYEYSELEDCTRVYLALENRKGEQIALSMRSVVHTR